MGVSAGGFGGFGSGGGGRGGGVGVGAGTGSTGTSPDEGSGAFEAVVTAACHIPGESKRALAYAGATH